MFRVKLLIVLAIWPIRIARKENNYYTRSDPYVFFKLFHFII